MREPDLTNPRSGKSISTKIAALIVCAECGTRIGKVKVDLGGVVFLETFAQTSTSGLEATRQVRLQSPSHPDRCAWCPSHGDRPVAMAPVFALVKDGATRKGKPPRLAV